MRSFVPSLGLLMLLVLVGCGGPPEVGEAYEHVETGERVTVEALGPAGALAREAERRNEVQAQLAAEMAARLEAEGYESEPVDPGFDTDRHRVLVLTLDTTAQAVLLEWANEDRRMFRFGGGEFRIVPLDRFAEEYERAR